MRFQRNRSAQPENGKWERKKQKNIEPQSVLRHLCSLFVPLARSQRSMGALNPANLYHIINHTDSSPFRSHRFGRSCRFSPSFAVTEALNASEYCCARPLKGTATVTAIELSAAKQVFTVGTQSVYPSLESPVIAIIKLSARRRRPNRNYNQTKKGETYGGMKGIFRPKGDGRSAPSADCYDDISSKYSAYDCRWKGRWKTWSPLDLLITPCTTIKLRAKKRTIAKRFRKENYE